MVRSIQTPKGIRKYQRCLMHWFWEHKRNYPWRRTNDSYKILIAEMLLQQTDAPKVTPIYKEFIKKYPSIKDLTKASVNDVSQLVAPLGLHYRAQRLTALSKQIVDCYEGSVPDTEDELLKLPGVGKYIARSICAVAFGQRKGVLDTNIIRILDRCFGIKPIRRRAREDPGLWDLVNKLLPPGTIARPYEWNWAMLDFAAQICTHYKPNCQSCPLPKCAARCSLNLGIHKRSAIL